MSNILNLPQIPSGTVINLSLGDWNDQLFVAAPGAPSAPITLTGALASSTAFTVASSGAVVPGMLAVGYGVTVGTIVDDVGPTTVTLSEAATITAPNASVTFIPPPMDLTGISFSSILRVNTPRANAILSMSTASGTMTNGGTLGQFGWSVPAETMASAPWPAQLATQGSLTCVLDIVATDATGARVNLCAAAGGPITVNVTLPVTR